MKRFEDKTVEDTSEINELINTLTFENNKRHLNSYTSIEELNNNLLQFNQHIKIIDENISENDIIYNNKIYELKNDVKYIKKEINKIDKIIQNEDL